MKLDTTGNWWTLTVESAKERRFVNEFARMLQELNVDCHWHDRSGDEEDS
jgi:hypothetical protein